MLKKKRNLDDQIFTNIREVNIADITADESMQQRATIHQNIIEEYAEILRHDGKLAPVKLVRDQDGKLWLWDGFHTLRAAKEVGIERLRAEISPGTPRSAWLKSLGANETHGIRRSRADRQKAIANALSDSEISISLLEKDGKHSFRSVASLCAVDHKTVSRQWYEIYLPRLENKTNEMLNHRVPSGSTISESVLHGVAKDLNLPIWWVKTRWEKLSHESEESLTAGEFPTRKIEGAKNPSGSEESLTAGEFPTRKIGDAQKPSGSEESLMSGEFPTRKIGDAQKPSGSEESLTAGEFPTRKIEGAKNPSGSEESLMSGEFPTRKIEDAKNPSGSEESLMSGEFPTRKIEDAQNHPLSSLVGKLSKPQYYSGQDAVQILTSYINNPSKIKVIERLHPSEGSTEQVSQEIGQTLSAITDDDNSSVVIVILKP